MKTKELKTLETQELKSKLSEVQKELLKLNAQVATGTSVKNPGHIRMTKRMVARLKTLLHARDLEKQQSEKKQSTQKPRGTQKT